MKAMVVYGSARGNTVQVARAIGRALGGPDHVRVARATEAQPEQLAGLTLLVVGSPTKKLCPLAGVSALLKAIPRDGLKGVC